MSKLAFVQLKTVHSLQHWEKHQENNKPRQPPQSFSVPAPCTIDVGCKTQRCNDPCLTTMMLLSTSVSDVCHIQTSPAQPTAWRWVMQSPCSGMWVITSPSFGRAGAAWGGHTAATVGSCCLAQAFLQHTQAKDVLVHWQSTANCFVGSATNWHIQKRGISAITITSDVFSWRSCMWLYAV